MQLSPSPSRLLSVLMVGLIGLAGPVQASDITPAWTLNGLAEPESVVHDRAHNRLVVSNIAGHPGQDDGEGFLSLVSPDGQLLEREWVTGLSAPKGMAIDRGLLYVSDLTRLHVVDLESGKIVATHKPENARFLNDVTVTASGDVFVTDMMAEAIYGLRGRRFEIWLENGPLHHPNGILADGDRVVIGNWGQGLRDDFTTEIPGTVLIAQADESGQVSVTPVGRARELGNIDGIVNLPGGLLVSDWVKGSLFFLPGNGAPVREFAVQAGVADIGTGEGHVYVPLMNDGSVVAYEYNEFYR